MTSSPRRLHLRWSGVVLGILLIGLLDYLTGLELGFFVFYFGPIILAAWWFSTRDTIAIAVLSACIWFAADAYAGHEYTHPAFAVWNTLIRFTAFLMMGWAVVHNRKLLEKERKTSADLARALDEVQVLRGLLPTCAWCKRIKDEEGNWESLESYITHHTDARFSHGMCDSCAQRLLEEAGQTV